MNRQIDKIEELILGGVDDLVGAHGLISAGLY